MLTKQELTKKRSENSEQLDLVETISSEDKLHKKRIFLVITIALTIGLSLVFWIYRVIANTKLRLPKLPSLPQSQTQPQNNPSVLPLDPQVSKVVDGDGWSIALGANPLYNWSGNREVINENSFKQIYSEISKLTPTDTSRIKNYLPEGVIIKEKFVQENNLYYLQSLVITPQKEILFVLKDDTGSGGTFDSVLSRLVPVLYWGYTL